MAAQIRTIMAAYRYRSWTALKASLLLARPYRHAPDLNERSRKCASLEKLRLSLLARAIPAIFADEGVVRQAGRRDRGTYRTENDLLPPLAPVLCRRSLSGRIVRDLPQRTRTRASSPAPSTRCQAAA